MGFWLKILLFLFISMVNLPVFAESQDDTGYLSIPDFVMQRITPIKTSIDTQVKDDSGINKQMLKLRPVYQPQTNEPPRTRAVIDKQQIKKTEIAANTKIIPNKETAAYPEKQQKDEKSLKQEAVPQRENISKKISSDVKEIAENNSSKKHETDDTQVVESNSAEREVSPDDIVKNINKINEEENKPVAKDISEKSIQVKEPGNDFLRTFFSLGVVLLLIFVFAWIYARVKGVNPTAILTGKFSEKDLNRFNVLSTSTLGQGKDIHLVEINGKQLVIGSTASNINLLTEIKPEDIEKLKAHKQSSEILDETENLDNQEYSEYQEYNENIDIEETEKLPEIELPDEENFYYESIEHEEFEHNKDSEYFPFKYSNLYKEYISKKDSEK